MAKHEVAILGVGMHPWGKWGRNFVEYGVKAARDALADAGIDWNDVGFIAGGETIRNGYPGFVAGGAIASALGFNGAQVGSSYGACASGSQAISMARAQILSGMTDVALVVGADTTPKGFFKPTGGERTDDPIAMYLSDIYTNAANLAGLPGISVPCGFAHSLPVGLQLIGNHFDEARILNAAHQYQQVSDWHTRAPGGGD